MYKKLKRFIIVPLLVITVFFTSIVSSYYSPQIVKATGLETVALDWFITALGALGHSYASTDDAKSSLANFRKYITDNIADCEKNSKDTFNIVSSGKVVETQKVVYLYFFDKLFKGNTSGASSYAKEQAISANSFKVLVSYVKSFFNMIDWAKNKIGEITKVSNTFVNFTDCSLQKFIYSDNLDSFITNSKIEPTVARTRFDCIKNIWLNLSNSEKQNLLDTFGNKYYVMYLNATSKAGYTDGIHAGSSLLVVDLPEDIQGIVYNPISNSGCMYSYVKSDGTLVRADNLANGGGYNLVDVCYKIDVDYFGNFVRSAYLNTADYIETFFDTTSYNYGFTGYPFLGRVYGSSYPVGACDIYVQFQGITDINKFTSLTAYNNHVATDGNVSTDTNNYATTTTTSVVTTGEPLAIDDNKSTDNVTPVDSSLVIANTSAGDYTGVQDNVSKAVEGDSTSSGDSLWDKCFGWLDKIISWLKLILAAIAVIAADGAKLVWGYFESPLKAITDTLTDIKDSVIEGFKAVTNNTVLNNILEGIKAIPNTISDIGTDIADGVKAFPQSLADTGQIILNGVASLVIPDTAYINTLLSSFTLNYPFFVQISGFSSYIINDIFSLTGEPPVFIVPFSKARFGYFNFHDVSISMEWYGEFKPTMDVFITGFFVLFAIWRIYKKLPTRLREI